MFDYLAVFVIFIIDLDIIVYGIIFVNGRGIDIGKNNKKEYLCIKYLFFSNIVF